MAQRFMVASAASTVGTKGTKTGARIGKGAVRVAALAVAVAVLNLVQDALIRNGCVVSGSCRVRDLDAARRLRKAPVQRWNWQQSVVMS